MGQGQRGRDGAQQGRFSAARPAGDLEVTACGEEVQLPRVLPLTGRVVDDADRETQRGAGVDPQPGTRWVGFPGDRVEGSRVGQRGQPDRLCDAPLLP